MTWTIGNYWIAPGVGVGYATSYSTWPGLQYFIARPTVSGNLGVKLKTEPLSITIDQVGLAGNSYTIYTAVTNQTPTVGTVFEFIGTTFP